MADEIVKVEQPWDVQVFEVGVQRVNALELAQRLGYNPKNPRGIIALIERRKKRGKLNDVDLLHKRVDVALGHGAMREVSDYWLSIEGAHLVATWVRTDPADEIRRRIIGQLLKLKTPAALAPIDPTAFMTSIVQVLENQTMVLKALLEPLSSPYVTKERYERLRSLGYALAEAKACSFSQVWSDVAKAGLFVKKGPAFSTVPIDRYDSVVANLEAQTLEERSMKKLGANVIPISSAVGLILSSRPADPATDIGVQDAARRFTGEMGFEITAESLYRPDGIYAMSGVTPLYEVKKRRPKSDQFHAPYLDEDRYQVVLAWMRRETDLARTIVELVRYKPVRDAIRDMK
jgi:hypothetical protein